MDEHRFLIKFLIASSNSAYMRISNDWVSKLSISISIVFEDKCDLHFSNA